MPGTFSVAIIRGGACATATCDCHPRCDCLDKPSPQAALEETEVTFGRWGLDTHRLGDSCRKTNMAPWYETLFAEHFGKTYDKECFTQGTVGEVDFVERELGGDRSK